MKHCHLSLCCNDLPFLKQKLHFLYNNFDQIIFIDYNILKKTNSDDGSIEYIESFNDHEKKIILLKNFNPDEIIEYNGVHIIELQKMFAYGSSFINDDIDIVWATDLDEFFTNDLIKNVENLYLNDNELISIDIPHIIFAYNQYNIFNYFSLFYIKPRITRHIKGKIYGHCNFETYGKTIKLINMYLYHFSYIGFNRCYNKLVLYNSIGDGSKHILDEWLNQYKLNLKNKNKYIDIYHPGNTLIKTINYNEYIPEYIDINMMIDELNDISKNCVLCIPVRNSFKYLDKIFNNILKIKSIFGSLIVCFYYDISSDNSLYLLYKFKKIYGENCFILENNEELLQYRTHRIANARNKLIEFIENNYSDYNYFIMMDANDKCISNINTDILNEYLNNNTWDSLSFNRSNLSNGNYDIWALQYYPFVHHCHAFHGNLDVVYIMRNDITNKLNSLKENELFDCYSAFNGFAIYRTKKFLNIRYDGTTQKHFSDEYIDNMLSYLKYNYNLNLNINYDYVDNTHGGGKQNCEHISFHVHSIIKNNARIRISGKHIFD